MQNPPNAVRPKERQPLPAILAVGSGSVVALALGPALRGEFVATQTLAAMAAVALTLGMTQAVVTYRGDDVDLAAPLLLQAGLAIVLGTGLFTALAVLGTQLWLNPIGVAGGAALTAGTLLASNSAGLAQRRGKMTREFQWVRLLPQAVGVLAAVLPWAAGVRNSDIWLLVIGLGIFVPSALLMVGLLDSLGALTRFPIRPPARELVREAAGSFVTVLGSQVIYRLDSLFVAIWLPTAKVAFYAVAVGAGTACAAIGQAVGMVTFSRLRNIREPSHQKAIIRRGTALALGLTSAVSLPLAWIAPIAIRIVYGSAFVPAVEAARILILAAIPLSADYLLLHALLSLGAARRAFRVQLVAGLLTIGLLAASTSTGRLVLVALVSLAVYSISAALLFTLAMRGTNRPQARAAVS